MLVVLTLSLKGAAPLFGVVQKPVEEGRTLFEARRYGDALAVLIRALERTPGDSELLNAIQEVTQGLAESERAPAQQRLRQEAVETAWHALGRLAPREADELLRQAWRHEQTGRWLLAWMTYQELATKKAPDSFLETAQKRQTQILRWLQAKGKKGKRFPPLYVQGLVAYSKEAFAEAIAAWQGLAEQATQRKAEVILATERARVEWEPRRRAEALAALTAKAKTEEKHKRFVEAKAAWTAILALAPGQAEAKDALVRLERKVAALEWTQTAKRHLQEGNLREAVQAALQAFRNDPQEEGIQGLMERVELQLARQALAVYEMVGPKRPRSRPPAVHGVPATSAAPGVLPPAAGNGEGRRVGVDSQQAATYYNLGLIQYVQGNVKEAITHWRKALVYDPFHTKAKQALDRALAEARGVR